VSIFPECSNEILGVEVPMSRYRVTT